MVKHLTNLQKLELIENAFNSKHESIIYQLIEKQKSLKSLKIFANGKSPVKLISAIKCLTKTLESFELIYAKFAVAEDNDEAFKAFDHLSKCVNLKVLILDNCEFSDENTLRS